MAGFREETTDSRAVFGRSVAGAREQTTISSSDGSRVQTTFYRAVFGRHVASSRVQSTD